MLKEKHFQIQLLKITFVFIVVLLISCKTQKQNVSPTTNQTNNSAKFEQMEKGEQEEEKLNNVTQESIEEQKVNEFAKKKSVLFCSLTQLQRDLNNTNNENLKAEINEQIKQLKNQIAELDKLIESTFPNTDYKTQIDNLARNMSKDC